MYKLRNPEVLMQHDGAEWHRYKVDDGLDLTLTSRGRELFDNRAEVKDNLQAYVRKALGGTALVGSDIRLYFARGSNSRVYTMGQDLLVKETAGHSMESALVRMDRIYTAIETHVPRWIDMPVHYGVLSGNKLHDDYMLMHRVDAGVNVGHIIDPNSDEFTELERIGVEKEFGKVTKGERQEIEHRFNLAEQILHQAIADEGLIPNDYLTDWHPGNVLVERLNTPIASSPYRLWVIDQ